MNDKIKQLYQAAGTLHKQAMDILAEHEGKEMPADKAAQVTALLDQVEQKTAEAKQIERAAEQEKFLNEAQNRPNTFNPPPPAAPPAEILWQGKELDAAELLELKKFAPFPGFYTTTEADAVDYGKALAAYYRVGLNGLSIEQRKALSVGDATSGGYLVQDTYVNTLLVKAREVSAMRRISNVLPAVPTGAVIAPSEENLFTDAEWTPEVKVGGIDTVEPFGQRRLQPKALSKEVDVSNTFMRIPTFDPEADVRDRMAYRFAIPEEAAFINGAGVVGPLGLLKTVGLPATLTSVSKTVDGDDVINWVYSLKAAYRQRARILCNVAFIRKVRTMKTGLGDYVWQPGLQTGSPNTILDVPYEFSDQFDDALDALDNWDANGIAAVIGDFSYYWIVDALQMTIQRLNELLARTNQVAFIGRKETDGMCVMPEAFNLLKVKP